MVDDLNERLRIIEERLTAVESKLSAQPAKQAMPYQFKPRPPSIPSPFMLWLKENWLVSIGILLITLAVVWFTGYAFANDWVGETVRIALGFIAGIVIFSVGFLLLKSKPQGGQALMILGEAITIIAIFAGHQVYPILSTFQSFLLMLVVVNLTAILAIKNNVEFLGLSSIVFAAIIPSLLINDSSNSIFLMLYVLALNGAAIGMWVLRGWGKTVYIAWLATFAYSWSLVQIQEKWIVYFFVWAFYLSYFLTIAAPLYRKKFPSLPLHGIPIFFTLNLAFIFWIESFSVYPWSCIFYFAAALLSAALGYLMAKNWDLIETKTCNPKYTLGAIIGLSTVAFTFFATFQLIAHLYFDSDPTDLVTLVYYIEVVIAILIGRFILQSLLASTYLSLAFIVPLSALFDNTESYLYAPFYSLKFATLCIAATSFFISARVNLNALLRSDTRWIGNLQWILAGIFAMALAWNICLQVFPNDNIARGVALILYIIAAEVLIYIGNLKQFKNLRLGGVAVIVFVVFRLLLEEVWQMPIVERTITFIVIGVLLMGTAFLDKMYKK